MTNEVFDQNLNEKEAKKLLGQELEPRPYTSMSRDRRWSITKTQGHTELAVGLARLSKVTPVVIGAEMLQPDGDLALSVEDAKWAIERGIPFLEGVDIVQALSN